MDRVISLNDIRFDTLHKHMMPVYAALRPGSHQSPAERNATLAKVLLMFFRRLRSFRALSTEAVGERTGVNPSDLDRFEKGQLELSRPIQEAYLRACGGQKEFEVLSLKAQEFLHPTLAESRAEIAIFLANRLGLRMDGLNYYGLTRPPAQVIELRPSGNRQNES